MATMIALYTKYKETDLTRGEIRKGRYVFVVGFNPKCLAKKIALIISATYNCSTVDIHQI